MNPKVTATDNTASYFAAIKSGIPSRAIMGSLASKGKTVIVNRTLSGENAYGGQFMSYKTEPYYAPIENRPPGYPSPPGGTQTKSGKSAKYASYADYKESLGLGATPQLSVSGEMLGDIDFIVQSETRAVLFFTSRLSAAKAHAHHTGDYPFFDLGLPADEQALNETLRDQAKKVRERARRQAKARRYRAG